MLPLREINRLRNYTAITQRYHPGENNNHLFLFLQIGTTKIFNNLTVTAYIKKTIDSTSSKTTSNNTFL